MIARCSHCGVMLDTRDPATAEHMTAHPPRGSYWERMENRNRRNERRAARARKYSEGI